MATSDSARRHVRLQISLSEAERAAIDDYRFTMRLPNLSEAVRQLLMTGMSSEERRPERRS